MAASQLPAPPSEVPPPPDSRTTKWNETYDFVVEATQLSRRNNLVNLLIMLGVIVAAIYIEGQIQLNALTSFATVVVAAVAIGASVYNLVAAIRATRLLTEIIGREGVMIHHSELFDKVRQHTHDLLYPDRLG